jgi:hypothetical protein
VDSGHDDARVGKAAEEEKDEEKEQKRKKSNNKKAETEEVNWKRKKKTQKQNTHEGTGDMAVQHWGKLCARNIPMTLIKHADAQGEVKGAAGRQEGTPQGHILHGG